jgi:hypothetical protein
MSNAEARDAAYTKVIGREYESFVDAEGEPRIEVRRYAGKPVKNGPECDVWVTSGMSDVEMTDDDDELIRRELIFYVSAARRFKQARASQPGAASVDLARHRRSHSPRARRRSRFGP